MNNNRIAGIAGVTHGGRTGRADAFLPANQDASMRRSSIVRALSQMVATLACIALIGCDDEGAAPVLSLAEAEVVAEVDPAFQSYNVEMVEVTGGDFWTPYASETPDTYEYRPPLNLGDARLRALAAELSPAIVRVSGTWANSTFFDATSALMVPPPGYGGVLTAAQWQGVGDFVDFVAADLLVSLAISPGTRDVSGAWTDDNARALLDHALTNDFPLVGVEVYNEPNVMTGTHQVPDYTPARFAEDVVAMRALVGEVALGAPLLGPSNAVAGRVGLTDGSSNPMATSLLLEAASPAFDVFAYHFYPAISERCATASAPDIALTEEFRERTVAGYEHYAALRDRHEPGAPLWLTETGQAVCGGDRWASRFADVFRYLDQLGRLAERGVQVVMHNTLAASDYALLDEATLEPRPNYWGAVLWQRLMGARVLGVEAPASLPMLTAFAHCGLHEGATWLLLNTSEERAIEIGFDDSTGTIHQLTAAALDASEVRLNGAVLSASPDGSLPALDGAELDGSVSLPPASVTFVHVDDAPSGCTP